MNTTDPATCGCCAAVIALTPLDQRNPPGQTRLHYRIGTHSRFVQTQLARLSSVRQLQALTTRDNGDPALALLDAWASVLDVLSFYQERIIAEGFLRTATERRSVLELARAIGYELRPGVAASTFLAFTLETSPGAPAQARIDAGTRTQSVPAQDEAPQVFETLETLQARADWNAIEVLNQEAVPPHWGGNTLYLQGQSTRLAPGDALLVIGDERRLQAGNENWDFRRVARVQLVAPLQPSADPLAGTTVVTLDRPLGSFTPHVEPTQIAPRCFALRTKAALFGHAAADWRTMPRSLRAAYQGLDSDQADKANISKQGQWPNFSITGVSGTSADVVHLDASYPKIARGSWVVLSAPDYDEVYKVLETREDARAMFALAGKSTRLTLSGEHLLERFNDRLRDTSVYADCVEFGWSTRPLSGLISGHIVTLAGVHADLAAGRWLALSGHSLADTAANAVIRRRLHAGNHLAAVEIAKDENSAAITFTNGERLIAALQRVSEVVQLSRNETIGDSTEGRSQLILATDLQHAYLPLTLRINANVAPASHGDSRQMRVQPEVLGSGNASAALQRFELRQKPLTYVSAPTPSGTQAALDVRVNGVRWHQAALSMALGANDKAYLVRHADDGTVTLTFGDGKHGQRLPSGQMNVQARYRVGLGSAGNLPGGQISMLLDRALGVKDVVNAVPAAGGADPEALAHARRNAPLTVLALDRIVSLRDFEDYAAAFTGVGKAQAVWLWDGEGRLVHLTVIGLDGAQIDKGSALYRNLVASIDSVRPANQALRVAPGVMLRFGLTARVRIHPDHAAEVVLPAVRAALAAAFGFLSRAYGQSLSGSEVVSVIHRVAGIERVDLDSLWLPTGSAVAGPDGRLRARGARWQGTQIEPAQLLLIDPANVVLTELSA